MAEIRQRHARACASRTGARCTCTPTYEAAVYVAADAKRVYKTFPTKAAAKAWQRDAGRQADEGRLRAVKTPTLADEAERVLEGMRDGSVRARGGGQFRAPVIREYESMLRRRVLPVLGAKRLRQIEQADLVLLVRDLHRQGLSPSSIRNTLDPVRVIFREACEVGLVPNNPTALLRLPTGAVNPRERSLTPAEAAALLEALADPTLRALWATAIQAGLRSGELRALRWEHVRLGASRIDVRQSLSEKGELQAPKTAKGTRSVPISAVLRDHLDALDPSPGGYVFGSTPTQPFTPTWIHARAKRAWKAAGLDPITLHEARHACASMMIAAGLEAKRISVFLGHASVAITFDTYGHLLSTGEDDAIRALDAFHARDHTSLTSLTSQPLDPDEFA